MRYLMVVFSTLRGDEIDFFHTTKIRILNLITKKIDELSMIAGNIPSK
jgi:hypothetical protein